jgi:hypothetical protein
LCAEWRDTVGSGAATPALDFVAGQLGDATSPLVVLGERALAAEFPPQVQARTVLENIGAGASTFTRLSERTGIAQGSLARGLVTLTDGGLVAADRPVSSAPSRLVHYRVADPYLRFWLRFLGPDLERILRGRGDLVSDAVRKSWPTYRGMAVEPVAREAVERLLPDPRTGAGSAVGRYWIRDGSLEVDLVIADRAEPAAKVSAVGSIKWRDQGLFDRHDVAELHRARAQLPGAGGCPTVAVTRVGLDGGRPDGVDVLWSAADLLSAWRPS